MKRFAHIIAVLFVLSSFDSFAQVTYQKTYGDVEFKVFTDVCTLANDELLAGGYWTPSSMITPVQPFLTKVDNAGNIVWSKEYANPGIGRVAGVASTADGGFLATGKMDTIIGTGGSDDGYVMKLDEDGTVEWMTIIGSAEDEEFTRVYESPSGDVIAVGTSSVQSTGDEYFWFVQISSTGTVINSFVYFPTANAQAQAVGFHPDGGYIMAGIGRVNFIDEAYLFKISSVGVLEWYKSFGTFGGSESINDLVMLPDTSIVFVGTRYQANRDVFIGKTDSLGELLWFNDYGGPDHEGAERILPHSSSGFVVSGWTEGLDGAKGPMLFKTDDAGVLEWTHVYGDGVTSGPFGMVGLSNNGIAMAGTILPNQGTAIGVINQVNSAGVGCNYMAVTLPSITETTVEDVPVVWASMGPSLTAAYSPTVTDVVLPDSTDCSNASLDEQALENQIKIYPNPVEGGSSFVIEVFNIASTAAEVEIFDCLGRSVFKQEVLQNYVNVSTAGWSPGVFWVAVRIGEQAEVRRVVVE